MESARGFHSHSQAGLSTPDGSITASSSRRHPPPMKLPAAAAPAAGVDSTTAAGGGISPESYFHDPKRLRHQARWDTAKLVLHCIAFCIALSIICVDGYVISYTTFRSSEPYSWTIIPAACSAAWMAAELVFSLVLARRRGGGSDRLLKRGSGTGVGVGVGVGIGPGWHVGVGLLLWVGCAITAVLSQGLGGWVYYWYSDLWFYGGNLRAFGRPFLLLTLFSVLAILHFTIFVRACVEVDRRNNERQVTRVFKALTQLQMNTNISTNQYQQQQQQQQQQHQHQQVTTTTYPSSQDDTTPQTNEILPQIPRKPVGAAVQAALESLPPFDIPRDSYRVIDPDVEANLKFMGPFPVESGVVNIKYPSNVLKR